MLTANRPEMARRAVECFRAQTYSRKQLFVLDTSPGAGDLPLMTDAQAGEFTACCTPTIKPVTIGELRNEANRVSRVVFGSDIARPDILIHWDDDDFSHPNRIAEQVALLQSSGADCVGYREMLFWRKPYSCAAGEACLYTAQNPEHVLGTSLCYWRKTWERKPFGATSQGEDCRFTAGLKVVSVSSFDMLGDLGWEKLPEGHQRRFPRMIARIHAGNTSNAYRPDEMARVKEWQRVPAWDEYCRGIFLNGL